MTFVVVEGHPERAEADLAVALDRFRKTKACPEYLREPADRWLTVRATAATDTRVMAATLLQSETGT